MGALLDTSVLVRAERAAMPLEGLVNEDVAISAITAAELLHGVHRASDQQRSARRAFVEEVLRTAPVIDFDLAVARVHARVAAELATSGTMVAAHDLIVAATAIATSRAVVTLNARDFARIPGLTVLTG